MRDTCLRLAKTVLSSPKYLCLLILVVHLSFGVILYKESLLLVAAEVAAQVNEPTPKPTGRTGESDQCSLGSPTKPEWAKLNEYDALFIQAGKEFGVDPNVLKAMAMIESGGQGHYAANGNVLLGSDQYGGGTSVGIMQIKPAYWDGVADQIGADLYEPEGNIRTAAKLMADWTRETGSWESAITERYHPGTGQHGLTQGGYVANVKKYMEELGTGGCADTSGVTPSPGAGQGKSTDESGCVITKVGNPQVSPTIPPSCGSAPGDYHNPLATPDQVEKGKLPDIVQGIATEMGAYGLLTDGTQFIYNGHVEHAGLDIGTVGAAATPVYAITDGVVELITIHDGASCVEAVSGCTLRLVHDNDEFTSEYVHIDPSVTQGQQIKRGQQIGTVHVWETESGYNDHLHFELRLTENRYNINPRIYFPEFEQFPISAGYNGDVRRHSATVNIFLEEGGVWAEKFRDHPPCPNKNIECWAM